MAEPTLGYVITWRYGDGSGSGAVAAFADKKRAERLLDLLNTQDSVRQFKLEPVPFDGGADGVMASQPWSIEVHCSKGKRTLRAGMRWRDGLHGSTWEVVEPEEGARIYSPSGFGGTPTFWCKPVGELPEAAKHLLEGCRADGCVSFCGDSIAAGLISTDGVKEDANGL